MATFTIRRLDDEIAEQFKQMARDHGRSTEAELRSVVEEVTRQYVEERMQEEETLGSTLLARIKQIWKESDLTEEEMAEPFSIPREPSDQRDPFAAYNEDIRNHGNDKETS